jgi:RNA recognition motif-containing protein
MGSRIYVGNLPFTADESQVRALFEPSGGVREVRIVEDRETGRPRGFAFVEMNSDAEAEAAIKAVHGLNFGGRTLTVNEARERENRGGGGGGGGVVAATAAAVAVATAAAAAATAVAAAAVAAAPAAAVAAVAADRSPESLSPPLRSSPSYQSRHPMA